MLSRRLRRIAAMNGMAVALVAIAVTATAALAATSWIVVIGTSGNDTINEGGKAGNYRIWGLAGKDTLTGGAGGNVLVGDGSCPPGATDDQYCSIQTIAGDGGDTLRGGGGNNSIYGGGGPNTMYGGGGYNYIQSGPSTNVIYGGQLGDTINATKGSSTVYAGKGTNFIDAVGPGIDHIYCSGKHDVVYADANDVVKNCAKVYVGSQARTASAVFARHARATVKKHASRRHRHRKQRHHHKHR